MRCPLPYGDDDTARSLLQTGEVWAVVCLSTNPSRAAYGVAQPLPRHRLATLDRLTIGDELLDHARGGGGSQTVEGGEDGGQRR